MLQYERGKTNGQDFDSGRPATAHATGPPGAPARAELRELGVIPDGALLIQDGVVVEAGPSRRVEMLQSARGATEINAAGCVVMPGFVDSHTHLLWPPRESDGAARDRAATYMRTATGQRIESRARQSLDAMARHGTTTVEVKTGFGLEENVEAKLLRVLAALRNEPLETAATFLLRLPDEGREEAVDMAVNELLPRIRRGRLARFADITWHDNEGLGSCLKRYLHAAQVMGFRCKVHADRPYPAAAIMEAAAHQAVSVDHLEYAAAEEAELMRGSGMVATLLPADAFRQRGPAAPARVLADAGVAVALASNYNPRDSPTFSMQTVISLATRELGLTLEEAISAATINGAYALDLADDRGSLECGKLADVVVLNAGDYRELAENFGGNLVRLTVRRGEPIYREGAVGPVEREEAPELR